VFVRVKNVRGRRYAYLVEGVREGRRVRQKTLCYLGPLSKLVFVGVPDDIMDSAAERFQVDWKMVNDDLCQIPLSFEELSEARLERYAVSISTRREGTRTRGDLPRADGELSALSRLAGIRFREMFDEVGELAYRLR